MNFNEKYKNKKYVKKSEIVYEDDKTLIFTRRIHTYLVENGVFIKFLGQKELREKLEELGDD